jgi:hypothetical protein
MQATNKGKRVPIGDIPAVQELADLKAEIDALKSEHADVFMQYNDLVDRYNAKLEEAEKEVRAQGVSCGAFENYSVSVKFNPAKMFDELGEEMFLKTGGAMGTVTEYKVDPKRVEAAIASGEIPEECVDNFREVRRNYHQPKKLTV